MKSCGMQENNCASIEKGHSLTYSTTISAVQGLLLQPTTKSDFQAS